MLTIGCGSGPTLLCVQPVPDLGCGALSVCHNCGRAEGKSKTLVQKPGHVRKSLPGDFKILQGDILSPFCFFARLTYWWSSPRGGHSTRKVRVRRRRGLVHETAIEA